MPATDTSEDEQGCHGRAAIQGLGGSCQRGVCTGFSLCARILSLYTCIPRIRVHTCTVTWVMILRCSSGPVHQVLLRSAHTRKGHHAQRAHGRKVCILPALLPYCSLLMYPPPCHYKVELWQRHVHPIGKCVLPVQSRLALEWRSSSQLRRSNLIQKADVRPYYAYVAWQAL